MVHEREKSLIEEPIVGTSLRWTETMTEVAVFPSPEWALGFPDLAARMRMFLQFRIVSARHGSRSCRSSGRNAMGREWMAS